MRYGESWDVQSDFVAIKEIDKTCIKGNETGIPAGMKSFFAAAQLVYGDRKTVSLIYDDISHEGTVYINKTNRCKLHWQKDFAASVIDYCKIGDNLRFERIADDTYNISIIKNETDQGETNNIEVHEGIDNDTAASRINEQQKKQPPAAEKQAQEERERQLQARAEAENQKKMDRMSLETKVMTMILELQTMKGLFKFFKRRKLRKEIEALQKQLQTM